MTKAAQDDSEIPVTQAGTAAVPGSVCSMPRSRGGPITSRRPSGLSRRNGKRWDDLHATYDFAAHEDYLLESYLAWDDAATALRREAKGLRGRERDRKLKAAENAATTALRHLRALKFTDPAHPPRRPGRPPGRRPPVPVSSLTMGGGHADGAPR